EQLESEDDQFMAEKVQVVHGLIDKLLRAPSSGAPVVLPREGSWGEGSRSAAFYLRVLGAEGRGVVGTARVGDAVPGRVFPAAEGGRIQGEERWLPDGRCFRLASVRAPAGDGRGPRQLIQVAMDRTQEEELISAYRWRVAVMLGLALLGCVTIGYRIARRGIR